MKKQKSSIKRDEYKRFLTFMQDKIGIKVLATRTCHSIEDCDVAFFKILKVYEYENIKTLKNNYIELELKNDKLLDKLADLKEENAMLLEKIEERQENIFIRILKYIFG